METNNNAGSGRQPRLVRPAPIDYKAQYLHWKFIAELRGRSLESWGVMGCWIPTSEQMPPVGKKVIVCGHWQNGNRWLAMARWQPAKTIDASMWDEYPEDWEDEDGDAITNPHDLWLEESVELETTGFLENVTHWMPKPDLPNDDEWLKNEWQRISLPNDKILPP